MKHMEELKEMLCTELDKIAKKGTMSAGDLDMVEKLSHSIKSLATIEAMEGYSEDDGYSMRMRGNSMRGNSYARNNGRYSRNNSYGYSRDAEDMVEQLEDMLEDAPDMKTKRAIKEAIKHIGE